MRLTVSSSEVHEDRVRDCVLSLSCDIRGNREKKKMRGSYSCMSLMGWKASVIVVLFIY